MLARPVAAFSQVRFSGRKHRSALRHNHIVVSNIRRPFVFGEPGMQRREIPEVPREAVREAIANVLCHRDYTTGAAVE